MTDATGRILRLRTLVRRLNRSRRQMRQHIESTCSTLSEGYRALSQQFALQQTLLEFQRRLLGATSDDDVFRGLFELYARRNGGLFGVALVCDHEAVLQAVGRFGMPTPDPMGLCERLARSLVPVVLEDPVVQRLDGQAHAGLFPPDLSPKLAGVTFLCMPLLPRSGQLIGLVLMYRKGEQPFTDEDVALGQMLAPAVAVAIQTNAQRNAA